MTFWQRIKKLNYYSKLGLVGLALISALLLAGIWFGFDVSLFFPEWYLNLMPIPFILARTMASASYVGTEIDLIKDRGDHNKYETWGTGIGIALGIALGITMDIFNPLGTGSIEIIQSGLVVVSCININGSLANRVSSCQDRNRRLPHERYMIGIFTVLGAALSIALLATAAAGAVSILGVTSFFTGGVPIILAGIFFTANVTSQMASTGDYVSKTISYIGVHFNLTKNPEIINRVNGKSHEYLGALMGVSVAVIFAAVIITALAITQPHLFAGVLGVIAAALIVTTCVSVLAGIISRGGRCLGNYYGIKNEKTLGPPTNKLTSTAELQETFEHTHQNERKRTLSCPAIVMSDKDALPIENTNSIKSPANSNVSVSSNSMFRPRSVSCPVNHKEGDVKLRESYRSPSLSALSLNQT